MLKEIIQTVPSPRRETMESILEGGYTKAAVGDMIRKIAGKKEIINPSHCYSCIGKKGSWCGSPPGGTRLCEKCRKWLEFENINSIS